MMSSSIPTFDRLVCSPLLSSCSNLATSLICLSKLLWDLDFSLRFEGLPSNMLLVLARIFPCVGAPVETVARRRRGVCMSTLFKGSTGTDDSGAWMYEKDMLVSPSRDGAGKSGASGSVDWAKISFAARSRLGRREERIVLTALVLLFAVPGVVEVFVIQ